MEKRSCIVLRHKATGLYFDRMADHSSKLWSAWRFPDADYLSIWLDTHSYAPEFPEDYEALEVEMNISIKEVER